VADEIRSAGGVAETAGVDALDEMAVDEHADAVAERGRVARHLVQPDHASGRARHGATQVAFEALEVLRRQLATELGPHGVRTVTLEDVANVAAFVASDKARTMTAATANVSCGALVD
jgi:3-oxoacyl-[acyl-carrier protein] reductase